MTSLRARQRDLARQSIVDACAELVNANHRLEFSIKEVADRAGVSLRTLYNYFSTREELLDAVAHTFDARAAEMGSPDPQKVDTLEELEDAVARSHAVFEALGGISEAFAQMPLADIGRDERRASRTREIAAIIRRQMPEVAEPVSTSIALLLRHLISHRSWFWLSREYGLSTDQVVDLVNWAVEVLIEAANAGRLPDIAKEP